MKADDEKLKELRRAASANLVYVYSGQAARDKEKLAAQRRQERKEAKRRDKRLISLPKKIAALRKELEGHDEFYHQCEHDENPLGYAEGMTPAQHQGLMEEIDSAREGCLLELIDLEDELRRLRGD